MEGASALDGVSALGVFSFEARVFMSREAMSCEVVCTQLNGGAMSLAL